MNNNSFMKYFVYFLMVLFAFLIIAPPLTRVFFKDNKSSKENNNNLKTASSLICRKQDVVGSMTYNISVTSNYSGDTLNKVTFFYEYPTDIDLSVTDNHVLTEINNIRSSSLASEVSTDSSTTFVLTKEAKEKDPTNTSLDTFFNPISLQQSTLEGLGYSCSLLSA